MGDSLLDQFGKSAARYEPHIAFVAEWLGNKNVAELERIATALYVTSEEALDGLARASRITQLKPHISISQSQEAINELDTMQAALAEASF